MRKLLTSLVILASFAAPAFTSPAEKKTMTAPAGAEAAKAAEKPARPLPFQGTVFRVNKTSNTFITKTKAGKEHVFHLTDKSKILKDDAPATLDDIKSKQIVRGSRIKLGENKWEVVKVIIGAKPKVAAKGATVADADEE